MINLYVSNFVLSMSNKLVQAFTWPKEADYFMSTYIFTNLEEIC